MERAAIRSYAPQARRDFPGDHGRAAHFGLTAT